MIETLVHTSDGKLISTDPREHYCKAGNKVRMIDEKLSARNSAHVAQGAVGYISEGCVAYNRESTTEAPDEYQVIKVIWQTIDSTREDIRKEIRDPEISWYTNIKAIEPVYD